MANIQDNIQVNLDQDRQVVPPAQVPAGAHTMLAFKVEQSKIPKYFGPKTKDTITALYFIHHMDDLARTNNWSDTVTYSNIANNLRGFAKKWLFSTVDMLDYMADQLTWMNIKPRFQIQFMVQTNYKLKFKGFSNLAMKPTESTCNLLNRVTDTMVIIKESYAAYQNNVQAPLNNINNGYLTAIAKKYNNDAVNNAMQIFKK